MRFAQLALASLLVATGACEANLAVTSSLFVCESDSDCVGGYVCAPQPGQSRMVCVPAAAGLGDTTIDKDTRDNTDACTPDCVGRTCGADGCGGSCGACVDGVLCSSSGQCVCLPQCDGKTCGQDGCGGSCGTCAYPEACDADICVLAEPLPLCEGGWCFVPRGEFTMGSLASEPCRFDDEERHQVKLTHAFWVAETEVTQAAWAQVVGLSVGGLDPSAHAGCDLCPVDRATFWDAVAYANGRSEADGLEKCYVLTGCSGTIGVDYACGSVTLSGLDCRGYRLATEAEWEYAARAGSSGSFPAGENASPASCGSCATPSANLSAFGWYCVNAKDTTHVVSGKQANALGLRDVHGNVWEWVWDIYGPYESEGTITNPLGAQSGAQRVRRGGAWSKSAAAARSANREYAIPTNRSNDTGLRLVRTHR